MKRNASRTFAFALLAAPGLMAQDAPLFEVVESVGALRYVKANRSGVTAWNALRSLEAMGVFELRFEMPSLVPQIEKATMSLSFDRIEAVGVAELCAVAAGLDLTTERRVRPDGRPGKLVATVVRAPSRESELGRQRLLDWGLRWYRNLLETELGDRRNGAGAEAKIRIDSALMDMARGNWASAAAGFRWLSDTHPKHPWVAEALLREAECRLSAREYEEAARRASSVMKLFRARAVGARAALLLAQATLASSAEDRAQGRFIAAQTALDSLVVQIELFLPNFKTRDSYIDVLLALAEAERRRGKPDRVLDALRKIDAVSEAILLSPDRWTSYNFLRGVAKLSKGDRVGGREDTCRFLRMAPKDARAPVAWLQIADTEFGADQALEALLAVRNALESTENLNAREHSRALIIEAKASIALGDVRRASESLLRVVRERGPTEVPGLVVDVGQQLLAAGRIEKAKVLLVSLEKERGPFADRARVLVLEAEMRQGQARALVTRAKRYAQTTEDADAQSRIAELAGDAYRQLGMIADAARAYDGVVR